MGRCCQKRARIPPTDLKTIRLWKNDYCEKVLHVLYTYAILKTRIGGHSQQTIHNLIANNEWSGAGFPKLRLPGPCEQVFGFSRSLCSRGSFLLLCSHGFRRPFSRSRKGESMCQLTHRKKQSDGYTLPEQEPRPFSMYYELYLLGGLYGRNPLSKSLFMAVSQDFWNRDAVFLSVLHCSHNRVQPNEQMVFPDLQVRFTSHFRYSKCGNSGKDANALRGPHSMYINQRLFWTARNPT